MTVFRDTMQGSKDEACARTMIERLSGSGTWMVSRCSIFRHLREGEAHVTTIRSPAVASDKILVRQVAHSHNMEYDLQPWHQL